MPINTNCPVCFSTITRELLTLNSIPVFNNVLYNTKEEARNATRGDFSLIFCEDCGHLFNGAYQADLLKYSTNYENSLHFSAKFQQYAKWLVTHLIENYDIKKKDIVEVGCGKGEFLNMICEAGQNRGFGFDESYEANGQPPPGVTFFQEFYSRKHENIPADLLICRHVLEHIETPHQFVEEVGSIVPNPETVFYFEVPNGLYTLRDLGIWDLIYEHFSYYNPISLATLFENNGHTIESINEFYNKQFLGIESLKNKVSKSHSSPYKINIDDINDLAQNFKKVYQEKIAYWHDQLNTFKKEGKQVVVWGGGSKGVTLLNVLPTDDLIYYIVDINPRKQGKYASGSGQQYLSPEDLPNTNPDTVIITNPIYKEEIKKSLNSLGLNPELLEA